MSLMNFDFIGKRYWWFALSVIIMIPGLISMAVQGFHLGIDFTGGTLLDLKFAQPVTVAQVRDVLKDYQLEGSTIQLAAGAQTEASPNVFVRTRVLEENERTTVMAALKQKVGAFEVLRVEKVGAVIGSELTRQAIIALVISWLLMIAYISFRFEFKFGVSAVLALIHDVIVVLGVFSLFRLEVDAAFVAAVLTIVGYSINDTIVIFDRIREDLKMGVRGSFAELINQALNQTLSRTIITSGTVFLATLALYLFGGGAINDFAFTFLIGILTGTYSSIYIASALVLWWHKGERPKTSAQVVVEESTVPARA